LQIYTPVLNYFVPRMATLRHAFRPIHHFSVKRSPILLRRAMASVSSAPARNDEKPFFPDEPEGPSIKTEIPGPKSKNLIQELEKVFDTRSLNMMADYTKSTAN
jgi:4-aminobutyrate aminotransferase / (S)-3-amino-2-methylpropionate transaminase